MKNKIKPIPQIPEERILDLLEIQDKLERLPRDKLMYIAGAVAVMTMEEATKKSG
ncbi:MAG: hypothetical protein HFE45_07065 [Oscillospiraceae bacterium]|nr:hypothetical protein [Oscillospiraceae bacterium]